MNKVQEQGFEIIPECFDRSEILVLRSALESTSLRRSRAGIRNALQIEAFRSIASDQRLVRLAQRTLGDDAVPFHATLFDKSPRSNWLVLWHQDTALPLREQRELSGWGPWSVKEGVTYAHAPALALEQILAIRVHLDNSTAENGPLRILPETHTLGVLSDDSIHELSTRIPPVECLVQIGGLLLMRPLAGHASSKATGSAPRRVLHIEYTARPCFSGGLELVG